MDSNYMVKSRFCMCVLGSSSAAAAPTLWPIEILSDLCKCTLCAAMKRKTNIFN